VGGIEKKREVSPAGRNCSMPDVFMLYSWAPRVQALNYLQVHHVPLIF